MRQNNALQVYYDERLVGTLAMTADHSKNFTYLYDEINDQWRLSPAYDLTYSNTYYGEHTTTIDGNGRNPGRKELLAVGIAAGMRRSNCERIIDTIQACVSQMLGEYM